MGSLFEDLIQHVNGLLSWGAGDLLDMSSLSAWLNDKEAHVDGVGESSDHCSDLDVDELK